MEQQPPQQQLFPDYVVSSDTPAAKTAGTDAAATVGTDTAGSTAGGRRRMGGARLSPKKTLMIGIGIVVVLVIIVIVVVWRKRYHSKPNCKKFTGDAAAMCEASAAMCGTNGPCLNAVAHCMPIADKLGKESTFAGKIAALSTFKESELGLCASSIARVDPKFVASMASSGTCLPPILALGMQAIPEETTAAYYNGLANVVHAAKPLVPWGVRVAKALPTCPPDLAAAAGAISGAGGAADVANLLAAAASKP